MAKLQLRVCLSGLLALAILLGGASSAFAERRVALVVGNDRYANLPPERQLQKAVNDAQAVGDAFARLGFEVIRGSNLSRQGIIDKLAELTAKLVPGDTAALFYAGHGVAIGGVNYLVPSDVPKVTPDAEARVRGASISEPDIVAELQAKGVRVALMVIDACRDNPFPRSGTRAIGNTRGLVESRPPRGLFVIYSAGSGQEALDQLEPGDRNPNSVFTRVFVQEVLRPGLDLGGLAIEVREKVAALALEAKGDSGAPQPHEQTPAYYDQTIGGRIFLAGRPIAVEPVPPPQIAALPSLSPPPPPPIRTASIAGAWTGTYFYRDGRKSVNFAFSFDPSGCRGRSEEINTFGKKRAPKLFANLRCSTNTLSAGQTITITKTYDGTGGVSHAVVYTGIVSSDLQKISGQWVINAAAKGNFSMSR